MGKRIPVHGGDKLLRLLKQLPLGKHFLIAGAFHAASGGRQAKVRALYNIDAGRLNIDGMV